MENTSKRIPAVTFEIAEDAKKMTVIFADGQTHSIDVNDVTAEIGNYAMWHGLKQKFVDSAAISRNPITGHSASNADKKSAILRTIEHVMAGDWNASRAGSLGGGMLLAALGRLYVKRSREDLTTYLATKTAAEKTALRKNPRIAAILDVIRAESGKSTSVDSDSMLDELDDDGDDE